MKKFIPAVFAMAVVALAAASTFAEAQWWGQEYDGTVDPTAATPAWVKAGDAASGTAKGGVWSQRPNNKWTGYKLTENDGSWQTPSTTTVEVRFRFAEQGEDGVIFVNWPRQWQVILKAGEGANDALSLAGNGEEFSMSEDWNIVRLLIGDGSITTYLLRDGALSGNGGDWTNHTAQPIHSGWIGYGPDDVKLFQFGGNLDIDYVRWTHKALVPPGIVAKHPAAGGAEHQKPPAMAKPGLYWKDDQLHVRVESPPPAVRNVVDLINRKQFDEAIQAIEALQGPDADRRKAELALAVAGHLDVYDPEPALKAAEKHLAQALRTNPEDTAALHMSNQIELYRAVPWLGLPPDPRILPSRDFVRTGNLEAGRKRIAESGDRIAENSWVMASFFQRRKDLTILLDDAEKALREAKVANLLGLLQQHRAHPWASLSVSPDSPLYPRVLLGRMRAYYWWWRQMGERYRPMSKQGFLELRSDMEKLFPGHDIVRMYKGERVPWGKGYRPDPVPTGAPGWAVNQRELRARVDYVVEWWFANRQEPNGELGGGWEDDCETLRSWSVTSIACGNPKIEAGIRKLVDGIWNSGQLVNGYDHTMKDVEHSSEMAADSSIMLALDYGDPLQFERFLQTTKTTEELHTAVNEHGHRHFRSISMSATAVREEGFDTNYHGRAMRPATMVAWYSGIPRAVDLVHDWAKAWSEETVRAGEGKPAGIMPAMVRFADDGVDGPKGKWWCPSMGDLYDWRPGRHDMVLGKMLGAWMMTGDDDVLAGIRAQFEIFRKYQGKSVEGAPAGSLDWAGSRLHEDANRLLGMYRATAVDSQFDDLLLGMPKGYARFMASGDPTDVEADHARDLGSMRFNLPMVTSEVRGTDRVALCPRSLTGPLTGSPTSVTEPPSFAVTWRRVDEDFTALVRGFDGKSVAAWVYSFAKKPARPEMRFWRLEPGRYELRLSPDANNDGKPDGKAIATIPFEYRRRLDSVRFDLPAGALYLLEVVQREKLPDLPKQMPDLALASREIKLDGKPAAGQVCKGRVIVHNIGSADATNVVVKVVAMPEGTSDREAVLLEKHLDKLAFPSDLTAKTAAVEFQWTPKNASTYEIEASVGYGDEAPEIYLGNNTARIQVSVAAP